MHILMFGFHSDVKSLRQRLNILDSPKPKALPSLDNIRAIIKKAKAERSEPVLWRTRYILIYIDCDIFFWHFSSEDGPLEICEIEVLDQKALASTYVNLPLLR